ncbi:MAG: hypothetical protein QOI81_857 [Actinomycetota bacterium]|jgi:uncharacterized protein (DUF2236 family)|nr:hypothetical protein [Actinomycetota bacterium]
MALTQDTGYFGPESVSWQVHKEITVLFGGARAVLMQAAHPLVIAGARHTGFYERNPWKRLQRTLILTYAVTFGTKAEADAAAERINDVHTRIHGVDEITGLPYDALDPELLLYVHACLVDCALLFEELTVGKLDADGRQRFHEEQMLAAEMMLVPREMIPPTVPALRAYLADLADAGTFRVTESARRVADLFLSPPPEAEWRPVLKGVSRLAFATLPPLLRDLYDVRVGAAKEVAMSATFAAIRATRPLLPAKFRYIAPYNEYKMRARGVEPPGEVERARKRAGVRLDLAKSIGGQPEGTATSAGTTLP